LSHCDSAAEIAEASQETLDGFGFEGTPILVSDPLCGAVQHSQPRASGKRLNTGLCTAQDQCVDIVSTFVRVHDLQIHEVPNHAVFV
jgi:hypothetical protein